MANSDQKMQITNVIEIVQVTADIINNYLYL